MQTTSLIVELLVVGVGALGWAVAFVLIGFGYDWVQFDDLTEFPVLVPAVAVVYVLGIIVDRIADWMFKPAADRIRREAFGSLAAFRDARAKVYLTEPFRRLLEYNRSRLRVCRGWALNAVLLVTTLDVLIWTRAPTTAPRVRLTVFVTVGLLALAASCIFSWHRLFLAECTGVSKPNESPPDADQS